LIVWHRPRFELLASIPGVDFLICETIPCLDEVKAMVHLINEDAFHLQAAIAVSCRNGECLNSGESIANLTEVLAMAHANKLFAGTICIFILRMKGRQHI